MTALGLTHWVLVYLLAYIQFTAGQNVTVLVHFGSGNAPASVVAADPSATTYLATYTNMCRSGPCSPLTIYTNIMIQGLSTAVRTNIGDPSANQTFACAVTSSLTTGTCTYTGTFRGTVSSFTTPMGPIYFEWENLTVTAGLDKIPPVTVTTTNTATTNTIVSTTATPISVLSTSTASITSRYLISHCCSN